MFVNPGPLKRCGQQAVLLVAPAACVVLNPVLCELRYDSIASAAGVQAHANLALKLFRTIGLDRRQAHFLTKGFHMLTAALHNQLFVHTLKLHRGAALHL